MGIEKEREAFEKECGLLCYKGNMVMSNLGNFYNNEQTNWMWQMWLSSKNQAVPEGFVLVEKNLIKTLHEELLDHEPDSFVVNRVICELWEQAEAQEQAHD